MALFNIKEVEEAANREIADEKAKKAKTALVSKLRQLDAAKQVVRNVESEIDDLKASIEDGSFSG